MQTFDIEKLEAAQLPELQGLKEKQLQIVKDNPFVTITDTKTYNEAKKARTALVSARTDIEKQDKLIVSKLNEFKSKVKAVSQSLIDITLPHEEKQKTEVKRYEAEKEAEKQEKIRIENERIETIKAKIEAVYRAESERISALTFTDLENFKPVDVDATEFEEFELDFAEKARLLQSQLQAKTTQLTEAENQRKENERLKAEREALEAEKAKIEAERKAEAERMQEEAAKLEEQRKALEAEKAAIAKAEAEKREAEEAKKREAERLERERIEAEAAELKAKEEAERLEALKPEKEKAVEFVQNLVFRLPLPEVKDEELISHLQTFVKEVEQQQKQFITFITNLK